MRSSIGYRKNGTFKGKLIMMYEIEKMVEFWTNSSLDLYILLFPPFLYW